LHHAEEAVRLAEVGQLFGLATSHFGSGQVSASRGMWQDAVPILERALAFARGADAAFQMSLSMAWLGYAYAQIGRVDEGVLLLEQSIPKAESIDLTGGLASIMVLQSDVYLRAGRRDEAHAAAQRGLDLCRRLKRRGSEAEALHVLGNIAATSAPLDA